MLGVLILIAGLGALAGCGGGSSTPKVTIPGTSTGTYTVTVTGSDASNTKPTTSGSFMVTVN
jgi:hypothetical protein